MGFENNGMMKFGSPRFSRNFRLAQNGRRRARLDVVPNSHDQRVFWLSDLLHYAKGPKEAPCSFGSGS
jgi:hypothetical protein